MSGFPRPEEVQQRFYECRSEGKIMDSIQEGVHEPLQHPTQPGWLVHHV